MGLFPIQAGTPQFVWALKIISWSFVMDNNDEKEKAKARFRKALANMEKQEDRKKRKQELVTWLKSPPGLASIIMIIIALLTLVMTFK